MRGKNGGKRTLGRARRETTDEGFESLIAIALPAVGTHTNTVSSRFPNLLATTVYFSNSGHLIANGQGQASKGHNMLSHAGPKKGNGESARDRAFGRMDVLQIVVVHLRIPGRLATN